MSIQNSSIAQIRKYIESLAQKISPDSEHDELFEAIRNMADLLQKDSRKSARGVLHYANRIMDSHRHWQRMIVHEKRLMEMGYRLIAGVDEAGRGPLAGPVVASAVILDPNMFIPNINDSKKLSQSRREALYAEIKQKAVAVGVGIVDVLIIDRINILQASLEAMSRAIDALAVQPDFTLIDGLYCPKTSLPMKPIVRGDTLSLSIASASIIAKVTRDRIMAEYSKIYPQYGFLQNKGYPTRNHLSALRRFGPCEIHRKSFAPVAEKLTQTEIPFNPDLANI